MCRHICPIGNATGQERNTARARALGLSLVERGAEPLSEAADNVYECALCGACTKECVTGWDPVRFTKEARLEIAQEGETPAYIRTLLDRLMATGNVYGEKAVAPALSDAVEKVRDPEAETLLFLGSDARFRCPDAARNAIELMRKLGVRFTVLADEPDSGYAMDFLVGAAEETAQIMKKTAEVLSAYRTVVCYDPADAKTFLREYKEWDIPLSAKIVPFPVFLASQLDALPLRKKDACYTLQDSAHLARDLEETASARTVLKACGTLKEMLLFGKDTMLAGNLIMNEYMPRVMADVAKARIINAENVGAQVLVTESPAEYVLLRAAGKIPVMSLEEVVLSCLSD